MEFQYKGLKAKYTRHEITQEEVLRQLEKLKDQTPRIVPIADRPTRSGDEVVLDYAGFCGGVQFAGGTAQAQTLVLGSGTFIPGFEEQLLDKMPGEEVSVFVTFPKEYHAPELAGKEAEFKCMIHQIRQRSSYEMDETFAREVGGCDNMSEMEAKMKEYLQEYSDRRGEMDLQEQLLCQAADTLDTVLDEAEVEAALDAELENMSAQLQQQGLSLDMYCQFMSTTREALREDARPQAQRKLKNQAAVDRIVTLEALSVTQEEREQAYQMICQQNRITMEDLKPHLDGEFIAMVDKTILSGKVMELIRSFARIDA